MSRSNIHVINAYNGIRMNAYITSEREHIKSAARFDSFSECEL